MMFGRSSLAYAVKTYQDMTARNVSGTTAETDCGRFTIPASVMGTSGALYFQLFGVKTGAAGTCTLKLYFGSTTLLSGSLGSTAGTVCLEGRLCNTAANSQKGYLASAAIATGILSVQALSSSVDTSTNQTFKYSITLSNSGDSFAGTVMLGYILP